PVEAGKPERALHEESILRSGAQRPLIVGDRLDTDIEAGVRWGTPSLLVFTGVTDAADLLRADEGHRPSPPAKGLGGLLEADGPVTPDGDGWSCGRWRAVVGDGTLRLASGKGDQWPEAGGSGVPDSVGRGDGPAGVDLADRLTDDGLDALRAAAVAAWQ